MNRRSFTKNIFAAGAIIPFCSSNAFSTQPSKKPIIIDADTANEVDDLYAIVRMVLSEEFDVLGLCSAQWFHQLSPQHSVLESQRLNDDLLRLMGRQDIPAPLGSELKMGKPWGGKTPADSVAARFIVNEAKKERNEKLTIISLGALTNVASAIAIAPEIIPNIEVFSLGGRYDANKSLWNKDEFNVRRDLNAFNFMLDTKDLDFTVMPINILFEYKFYQSEVTKRLLGKGGVWDYLVARWKSNAAQDEARIFWDLALAIAVLKPELATIEKRDTPAENEQQQVGVYTAIDTEAMLKDWWDFFEAKS
jgi:inosine-uridine nucleoside N-ribohydrolase